MSLLILFNGVNPVKSAEGGYFIGSRNFAFGKIISQGKILPFYKVKSAES